MKYSSLVSLIFAALIVLMSAGCLTPPRLTAAQPWDSIIVGIQAQGSTFKPDPKYSHDPKRFEKSISRFESLDKKAMPKPGGIVFAGSSSIIGWHRTIKEDLAPLTVIPRGFGGSNMFDLLYYTKRIVTRYKPRAVVIYEGDNDIAIGVSPKGVHAAFREFVRRVHKELPKCRIYFLAIKPSIARQKIWSKMVEANKLIAADCKRKKLLTYLDVAKGMLDAKGNPKAIFKKDNLHMARSGYVIWRNIVRPILMRVEAKYEKQ